MKAVQHFQYGDPTKTLRIVELETPTPKDGEVKIAVEATPFRFADLSSLQGRPGYRAPVPAIPGGAGIGRITEVGTSVTKFVPGDRVYLPRAGTWREYITWPADKLFAAPAVGDAVALAQVDNNGFTAHTLLRRGGYLKQGDWMIQSAANSNCGRYMIQLAKRWGIRTVNVVRREAAIGELRKLGADIVVLDGEDLGSRVVKATGGAEIRFAVDMVGGATTGHLAQCLSDDGVILVYGWVSGKVAEVPFKLMAYKQLTMHGFLADAWLRRCGGTREDYQGALGEVADLILSGQLHSHIAGVYRLDEIHHAVKHMMDGADGKIVLVPAGSLGT